MSRFFDWLVEVWDWLRRLLGFDRLKKSTREQDLPGHSRLWAMAYFFRPALAVFLILYFVLLVTRFTFIRGDDLQYPQRVMTVSEAVVTPGEPLAEGGCAPSQTVAVTAYVLDVLVNQNTWVPMDPQFKIGWFGLIGFAPTPFFDNKASFQTGALRAVRRVTIELADLLGRARRTSAADPALEAARGALQLNERMWLVNPFESDLPLVAATAASNYRKAIRDLNAFNDRLRACEAVFDGRADNLFVLLDRIANDVGGVTDELATRSRGTRWDVASKSFVPGEGNNRGVFDFRADNAFFRAHGMMWAYHGIMQAARADFGAVLVQSNLNPIWDRMEIHLAEAAALEPLIVSNGREDSLFTPDHLSAMSVNMLRAQQNMVEIREVLNR